MAPLKDDMLLDPPALPDKMVGGRFPYESVGEATMPSFRRKQEAKLTPDLQSSLIRLTDDCSKLLGLLNDHEGNSPTLDASRESLCTDMTSMLAEANTLLMNTGTHIACTTWRASLAQARADSYLETIKVAMASRDLMDNKLAQVISSIASQFDETKTSAGLPVRISSWRTPSLCFDLEVGESTLFVSEKKMPLRVRARAIAEIHAKDIDAGSIPLYHACRIQVEECKHEERTMFSLAGTVGEALVKIRISHIGSSQKKKATWGEDKDVGFLRVKEARILQENAFPPLPKRTADLYTSTYHGSSDICVMLRFKTHMVHEVNDFPEINIELVMASS